MGVEVYFRGFWRKVMWVCCMCVCLCSWPYYWYGFENEIFSEMNNDQGQLIWTFSTIGSLFIGSMICTTLSTLLLGGDDRMGGLIVLICLFIGLGTLNSIMVPYPKYEEIIDNEIVRQEWFKYLIGWLLAALFSGVVIWFIYLYSTAYDRKITGTFTDAECFINETRADGMSRRIPADDCNFLPDSWNVEVIPDKGCRRTDCRPPPPSGP